MRRIVLADQGKSGEAPLRRWQCSWFPKDIMRIRRGYRQSWSKSTNKRMRRESVWCSLRRENFDIPSPEDQEDGAPFTNDREKEK